MTVGVTPTVSVVLPTYQRAHLLGRAIRSALHQTYQDLELIIVDDGSTDDTEEVVSGFADERIRYLKREPNSGAAVARNVGLQSARGEYIAFADSDCEWLSQKLQRQMEVFARVSVEVGIVYTDLWSIGEAGVKKYWHSSRIMPEDGKVYEQMIGGRLTGISLPSVVMRRECLAKVGMFDEDLPRLMDRDLYIRLSRHYLFYHVEEALLNHYASGNGISSRDTLLIEAESLILQKYYDDITKNRRSIGRYWYVIGHLLCQTGGIAQGRRFLFQAVQSHPSSLKYLVAAFLSLAGERAYDRAVRLKRLFRPLRGP